MLRGLIYPKIKSFLDNIAASLAELGLTPNHLTFGGAAVSIAAAFAYSFGLIFFGGLLVLFAGACDMLDGPLARVRQLESKFGAFTDSTVDRYSDCLILGGIAVHFYMNIEAGMLIITLVALAGSLATSYAKARAESLGVKCDVGLIERPERIIIIAIGSLPGLLIPAMWVLAILSNATVIQRIVHVRKELLKQGHRSQVTSHQ